MNGHKPQEIDCDETTGYWFAGYVGTTGMSTTTELPRGIQTLHVQYTTSTIVARDEHDEETSINPLTD